MNTNDQETLAERMANYGAVLADAIEQDRVRRPPEIVSATSGPRTISEPVLAGYTKHIGQGILETRSPRRLVAVSAVGIVVIVAVAAVGLFHVADPEPITVAATNEVGDRAGDDPAGEEEPTLSDTEEPEESEPGEDPTGEEEPLLTVDIFSGLPNPVVRLSEDDLSDLTRKIVTLPQAQFAEAEPNRLGFRGFRVTPFELNGIRYSLYVADRTLFLTPLDDGASDPILLVDDERVVHKMLREAAALTVGNPAWLDEIPE